MKKIVLVVSFLCVAFITNSCRFTGDNNNSFPKVETDKFIKEDRYIFPVGTTALELYNCFNNHHTDGSYSVSGSYSHTETAKLNGNTYTNTIIKNIKIYRSKTEVSNRFHVDFITDTGEVLRNYYEWQYQSNNSWHNNKIDGDITILKF